MKSPLREKIEEAFEILTYYVPNKILILPTWADTCNLEDKNTVIVKEIVDLTQELRVSTNADVLKKRSVARSIPCTQSNQPQPFPN